MGKLKQYYPVIFITLVVLISISLLALTDSVTAEKIQEQKELKVTEMLQEMFPDMDGYVMEDDIYVIQNSGQTIGYAYIAQGKGYGGFISILVGLEDAETVKGISIIDHSETPGLGARITEDAYYGQYKDLKIEDSDLTFNGGSIDAITGATISSQAVANAVKTTAMEKVKELFGEGGD